jgi:hypothetical protein
LLRSGLPFRASAQTGISPNGRPGAGKAPGVRVSCSAVLVGLVVVMAGAVSPVSTRGEGADGYSPLVLIGLCVVIGLLVFAATACTLATRLKVARGLEVTAALLGLKSSPGATAEELEESCPDDPAGPPMGDVFGGSLAADDGELAQRDSPLIAGGLALGLWLRVQILSSPLLRANRSARFDRAEDATANKVLVI